MQEIHTDFYFRGFRKKQTIFVQQSFLCSVPDSSWESAGCAHSFQGLLSIMHLMHSLQQLTKEMSYKEKEILWCTQEESGEETEKLTIIVPCLIYTKRFAFQKTFSMELVHRYVFGGLGAHCEYQNTFSFLQSPSL